MCELKAVAWDVALWAAGLPWTPADATLGAGFAACYLALFAAWGAVVMEGRTQSEASIQMGDLSV